MIQTLTYGELPEFERFKVAFDNHCLDGFFTIRGCHILDAIYEGGDVDLTLEQAWGAVKQGAESGKDNHELEEIAIHILNRLGFDWV